MTVAVIADIVGSRRLEDRSKAQRSIEAAVDRVDLDLPVSAAALRPTVGDELQGAYGRLNDALASLLLLRLALPDGIECRFGIGIGDTSTIPSAAGGIADGPGWWAARAAIDAIHRKQLRAAPNARTWVVAAPGEDEQVHIAADLANAYLLARDQLVSTMTERTRRLVYGRCRGIAQRDLAHSEKVTQSAVSQALSSAGGQAIVTGFFALQGRDRP